MDFMRSRAHTNHPSIRLEIGLDIEKTTEVSYNRLMVQTFKSFKKQSGKDEKANFKPSSHYNYINTTSLKAISDLSDFKDETISKNELMTASNMLRKKK